MSTVLASFGQSVRALRERLGLSQEELGTRANLHRTYIGGVERGERNVSLLSLLRIARALEVSPADLLEESEPAAAADDVMFRADGTLPNTHPRLAAVARCLGVLPTVVSWLVSYVSADGWHSGDVLDALVLDGRVLEHGALALHLEHRGVQFHYIAKAPWRYSRG